MRKLLWLAVGFNAFDYRQALTDSRTHAPHHGENCFWECILPHGVDLCGLVEKGGTGVTPLSTGKKIYSSSIAFANRA